MVETDLLSPRGPLYMAGINDTYKWGQNFVEFVPNKIDLNLTTEYLLIKTLHVFFIFLKKNVFQRALDQSDTIKSAQYRKNYLVESRYEYATFKSC